MKKKMILGLVVIGAFTCVISAITFMTIISVDPITDCESIGDATPLCGWQNPEDMEALPDGRYVLVSEIGGQDGSKPGMLSLLNLETETREILYEGGSTQLIGDSWGEETCTEVAEGVFSPHGIHLSEREDGTLQLFVVQHGERESIEMFQVMSTSDSWQIEWRGCVIAPKDSMINDVVGTSDGGFLVTHMMTNSGSNLSTLFEYIRGSVFGIDTGYVLTWNVEDGFDQLANSDGIVPNGIQISEDETTIFVNYSNGELRRINRLSGDIEARNTSLPPLDNATWTPDGQLVLAAGTDDPFDPLRITAGCTNLESGICPVAHTIIQVDPETLEGEVIYEGGPDTPGGTGTVGLRVSDGSLLVGTFAGDRIIRVTPQSNENE